MMGLSTERKIVITLLILSASSLFFTPPLVIRLIFGFLQAYYLPGLVFLLFLGDRRRPRFDNLYLPILISPIIISLLVLAVYRFTGSFNTSIKISLSVLYILLVTALFTGKFRHTERDSTVPGSILLLSFLFCGVVTITYLVNRYILVYTDAWYHVSVVYEILDRGIPPMDPRLPDIPIRYMWFYHLFQAIWKELSGLSITHVLGFFNIINAFAFPYLIARLTSIFTKDRLYILSAPVFAFVGLESAGWVLWPLSVVRAFFGDVGGTAELARIISGIELNGVKVIYFLKAPWTWLMSLPDKFLTITAFSYTLNLFLLCFILVLAGGFHKRSSFKAAASIFLTMIGALLFHVVTGLGLILTAIGAGMLLALVERLRHHPKPPIFQSLIVPCTAIAAAAAGAPYFASLTGGGEGNLILDHLHIGFTNLFTMIAPLIVLLPFSLAALKKIFTSDSFEFKILAAWITPLIILSIFSDLPGIAENKLVFPFFLLLVAPIAWQIVGRLKAAGGTRLILLSVWVVVLFLIPPILTVRGFMLEKPKITKFQKRYQITDDERKLFDWIRNNTEIHAVIIEKNMYNLMPVYARRRNFLLNPTFIYVHDYGCEKVEQYIKIHKILFSKEAITAETIDSLRSTGYDFYVVIWSEELIENPDLQDKFRSYPEWFTNAYQNPAGKVYIIRRS